MHGDHVWMGRCELMQCDLAQMQLALTGVNIGGGPNKAFDGVESREGNTCVARAIDDTISATTQDRHKLKSAVAIVKHSAERRWTRCSGF